MIADAVTCLATFGCLHPERLLMLGIRDTAGLLLRSARQAGEALSS